MKANGEQGFQCIDSSTRSLTYHYMIRNKIFDSLTCWCDALSHLHFFFLYNISLVFQLSKMLLDCIKALGNWVEKSGYCDWSKCRQFDNTQILWLNDVKVHQLTIRASLCSTKLAPTDPQCTCLNTPTSLLQTNITDFQFTGAEKHPDYQMLLKGLRRPNPQSTEGLAEAGFRVQGLVQSLPSAMFEYLLTFKLVVSFSEN